ncbi:MATE family efflux transporter [Ideonella sp. A 288]|uniref:MATE family efflux transporter n=1 Tax=Ideonella sp. A 288 TaxID=1962181 RepID=UPI000B4B0201|nr:MATE family efflux transporter [Ideonella sp. A 288]
MSVRSVAPPPRLLPIAAPLCLELCLGIAVGVIGTALAARTSDAAAAAFAVAHQVLAVLFILFRIVGAGVGVVVAQSLGGSRREAADDVARATLGASTWVGLATAALALAGAAPLMRLLNTPAEVLALAAPLLQMMAPALLLDAWNATLASVMRAHLRVRDTLAVILAMHATHLLLALAWMPSLGLAGFAAALAASRVLGLALHLGLWRWRLGLVPHPRDWWQLRPDALAAVLRIGLPGAAENIAWRLSFMVSVAVAGQLGAKALATQAYALQVTHVALLTALATGLSVEIVVGHLIGAGRLHEAHRLVRRALAWGLGLAVLVAGAAALGGRWLLGWFTQDAEILATGSVLLWWMVLLEPGRTFNLVVINALRAAGDARYPVVAGSASLVVVLAGGSWLLGHVLGLGLVGIWIAYTADEWLRGLLMWRRWARLGWVPHARAAHRRLRPRAVRPSAPVKT